MEESTVNTKPLDNFIRALKESQAVLRVGILGKNTRSGSTQTNAEIGAKHEFGSDGMPQRSFLRVPLQTELGKYLEDAGAFDDEALKQVVQTRSVKPWLTKVGIIAENVIADAFASGGFGQWEPWRTPGYENNTGQILVDTQQLRDSIGSEVKGR